MSFTGAVARLQQAVFDRLGEDATWSGVGGNVRVRRREFDEEARFDQGSHILTVRWIKVRRSEVPAPAEGDEVQILDDQGAALAGALYVVDGESRLDRKGTWTCPVRLT